MDDPDFEQMERLHVPVNNKMVSRSNASHNQKGAGTISDQDFSLKNKDRNEFIFNEMDQSSSIRNIRDHRAALISGAAPSEAHGND